VNFIVYSEKLDRSLPIRLWETSLMQLA